MDGDRDRLPQGDGRLLEEPAAKQLLEAALPARMGYTARDGTPRIVPSWFHWTGTELVTVTYIAGPGFRHGAHRLADLRADPRVAVSIDTNDFPPTILMLRGSVSIDEVDGIADEYAASARRYLGSSAAAQLLESVNHPSTRQARIVLRPDWVGLLDFATRLPGGQGGITAAPAATRGSSS